MAYSISVAVGDSETMACGTAWMVTEPLAAEMVAGNDPEAAVALPLPFGELLHDATSKPSPAQAASSGRCERCVM